MWSSSKPDIRLLKGSHLANRMMLLAQWSMCEHGLEVHDHVITDILCRSTRETPKLKDWLNILNWITYAVFLSVNGLTIVMSLSSLAILPPHIETLTINSACKRRLIFAFFSSSWLQFSLLKLPSSFAYPYYYTLSCLASLAAVIFTPVHPPECIKRYILERDLSMSPPSSKKSSVLLVGREQSSYFLSQETSLN